MWLGIAIALQIRSSFLDKNTSGCQTDEFLLGEPTEIIEQDKVNIWNSTIGMETKHAIEINKYIVVFISFYRHSSIKKGITTKFAKSMYDMV